MDSNNINENVIFLDPNSNISLNSSILIPASYIQERAMTTGKLFFPNTRCMYCDFVTIVGINPVPIVNINYENIQNILL